MGKPSADEPHTPAPLVAGQVTAIAASAERLRPERAVSTSATLWLGARLVPDLDAYLSPELAAGNAPGGGSGLVSTPDSDLLAASPPPQLYLSRTAPSWNDATWDYPQDVHGYSRGALASFITPRLAVRAGAFQLSRAPGSELDLDPSRSRGEVVEAELAGMNSK